MESSMSKSPNLKELAAMDYWTKRGKLKLWTGTMANEAMQDAADRQRRNQDAEERAAHRSLWGEDMDTVEDDEMRQTVLGDQVTQHTHEAAKSGLSPVAAMLLGMLIPGAGVAGYAVSQWLTAETEPSPIIQQIDHDDETTDLGLGKIEDYETSE